MTPLHRFPDHPGFLVIEMDDRSFFSVIRNPLPDLAVLLDHQHTLHIRDLRRDRIRIADIAHSLHTLRRHLLGLAESLIEDPERLRYMTLYHLIPGKYYHLLPVAQIQIPCLLFISYQIRI